MELDKQLLVNIVMLIHMALTGIMLFRLFKLKSTTGGQLIITFIALLVPILGPSAMIWFFNKKLEKPQHQSENGKSKKRR